MTLHDFIHQQNPPVPSESIPYLTRDNSSVLQIWTVMSQIASGVEYIHRQRQVHRDIKPGNGDSLFSAAAYSLSSLFM